MTAPDTLPRALEPFVAFPSLLRENGFAVAPEQTAGFVAAVNLLGPNDMGDIHRAARAMFAPPPERHPEFDALFRMLFLGQSIALPAAGEADEDEILVGEEASGEDEPPEPDEVNEAGGEATASEILAARQFATVDDDEALRRFRRVAQTSLPVRRSYRRAPAKRGDGWNMRKVFRQAVQRDGEVTQLPRLARKMRQRRIVLLIDVSGSMKEQTDSYLRFAHALAQAGQRIEIFTLGTRLTRITRALKVRNRAQALSLVSGIVADWDGGTRLGDALQAFLDIPRFAGFARGAVVIVLSDGLERGDHAAMTDAVECLSRLVWRLEWLTPLAADVPRDRRYSPETEALQSVMPFVDSFGNASTVRSLCAHVLALGREAA